MYISGFLRITSVIVLSLLPLWGYSGSPVLTENAGVDAMNDRIKEGIENVVHIVSARLDAKVESFLRSYLEKNRTRTEMMIGRSSLYFPMFEEELEAAGLPTDLKYLAVIESALTPQALSHVGATGLWQFMRPTARECGLQITKYVDERCDPVKSTRAAILYLRNLYTQFDSWELAMAAYNAGPGRVRYAIRKTGSRDYWKLQGYLPKETRNYVPGFIAASYVLNYYQDHGLEPEIPVSDMMFTETIQVYKGLSFTQIQQVTGVPYDIIKNLNPKYIRNFIPMSASGQSLALPRSATTAMNAYLSGIDVAAFTGVSGFKGIETGVDMEYVDMLVEHTYLVRSGDNLYTLAQNHNCTVDELQKWNRITGSVIHIGQQLKIKRMEKVLVKAVHTANVNPPTRHKIVINVLPFPEFVIPATSDVCQNFDTVVQPVPQIKSVPNLSRSTGILRRRMSVRNSQVDHVQTISAPTPERVAK